MTRGNPSSAARRPAILAAACLAALCGIALASLLLGSAANGPAEVLAALGEGGRAREIILEWRIPRLIAALAAGAALALAGAMMQRLTRNPLASPDVLGIGQGAASGAIVAVVFFGGSAPALTLGSTIGGIVTAVLVFAIASAAGLDGRALLLIGIGIGAALSSLDVWLLVHLKPSTSQTVSAWTLGSLTGVRWGDLAWPCGAMLAGAGVLILIERGLRQFDLGDDLAAATGVDPRRILLFGGAASVALAAAAVAVCGPVAFVALLAPHLAAALTGRARPGAPAVGLTGALVLSGADLIGQHLLGTIQLPVGIVTGALGAVGLCCVLLHESRPRTGGAPRTSRTTERIAT